MVSKLPSVRRVGALFNISVVQQRPVVTHAPVNLAYVEIDDPQNRSSDKIARSPLIILHGLFGSTQNWRSVGKALNGKLKRKVVLADLRNHGDSPHSDLMTFSELAADLGELVTKVNPATDHAVLLGHSLGGLVCAYFALIKPKRVEKLIIEDVAPKSYFTTDAITPWSYVPVMKSCRWRSSNVVEARHEVNEQLAKIIEDNSIRQFLLTNLVDKGGRIGWRINLDALHANHDRLATFPQEKLLGHQYDGPTLVIRGGKSEYVKDEDSALFDTFFQNWTMKTVDDSGHWVHSEQPSRFIHVVEDFLKET